MINIPLIFWLVLSIHDHAGYNQVSTVVLPIPFSSQADCITGGKLSGPNYSYVCIQQRASDVEDYNHPEAHP